MALRDLPGYKVFTSEDLKAKSYPGPAKGEIYAIFEVVPDPVFDGRKWDGRKLQEVMTEFESRRRYREVKALGNLSAYRDWETDRKSVV